MKFSENMSLKIIIKVTKKQCFILSLENTIFEKPQRGFKLTPSNRFRVMTTMLRSNLCDYADPYILVKGTITITGAEDNAAARQTDERDKGVIFKNCASFTKCISKINGTDIDNVQDIDIVMPMHNLIEHSNNYSKTSRSLWQYYEKDLNNEIARSESFKSKVKITGKTRNDGKTKEIEIMVPVKYLSNFWRTLEMPLINCEVNLILSWSKDCVITNSTGKRKIQNNWCKIYVPVISLSTQDNAKLLQQLNSGFRGTINSIKTKNICTKQIFKSLN